MFTKKRLILRKQIMFRRVSKLQTHCYDKLNILCRFPPVIETEPSLEGFLY